MTMSDLDNPGGAYPTGQGGSLPAGGKTGLVLSMALGAALGFVGGLGIGQRRGEARGLAAGIEVGRREAAAVSAPGIWRRFWRRGGEIQAA